MTARLGKIIGITAAYILLSAFAAAVAQIPMPSIIEAALVGALLTWATE